MEEQTTHWRIRSWMESWRFSRAWSQDVPVETTPMWSKQQMSCEEKTVGTENFHLRCILLRSRYLSIWQEKELRQTLWKLEQSSVQLSVDRALVQAIRRAITDSVSVIRPEISRTEKDPNQETDRCQPLRLWMPVPSQQQRQTRDSLHQQKNLTAGERYRNILLTILFTETAFIMVSRRAMRRKIWYTDRISKTGRKWVRWQTTFFWKYAQKLWILSQQQMNWFHPERHLLTVPIL